MDLYEFAEYREIIFNEAMGDATYDNRLINALYYMYSYDEGIGEAPGGTFDLVEAQDWYDKFKNWAQREIQELNWGIDEVYDDYYDEMVEEEGDEVAAEIAFEHTMEYVLTWKDNESIKWCMKEENISMNKDIEELKKHVKEFDRWKEWDSCFEYYIEEMPTRMIEERVFKDEY